MRFALLGDHADGLAMARALVGSGRHELAVYNGLAVGMEYLQRWGFQPARVGDLEEVLADPKIDAVIVAGRPAQRPGQLRRSLQSERQVLCVCPVDDSPDVAYEAALAQTDAGVLLFPLLAEALHPAFQRLGELAHATLPRLVEVERWSSEEILLEAEEEGHRASFPGWDLLRRIGGEIGELFALSAASEVEKGQPLLLVGQFVRGGLFQTTYLPLQAESRLRVALVNRDQRAELTFAEGWPGPCRLAYTDDIGHNRVETWDAFDPWQALVAAWEAALLDNGARPRLKNAPVALPGLRSTLASATLPADLPAANLSWQDAIRGLELDDAARRSIHRRRASTLEFQEATEEAGFKGTMTLVGCSILWISLVLLILSAWLPWLGWIIAPVFGIFLVMQLLRWVVPPKQENTTRHLS